MKFRMVHENFNIVDLDRSLAFYDEALGLKEKRRKVGKDGSFILVYLVDVLSTPAAESRCGTGQAQDYSIR